LMILGAGRNEIPAIKKAKEMGVKTLVCDMNENAPGLRLGDYNIVAKTRDPAEYVNIAKRYRINGVMTVSVESLVRTISIIAEEMGLTGISRDAASKVTNKVLMKKALKSHRIPCGAFVSATSLGEALENVKKLKFPIVIKPADRAGSRGVFSLEDEKDLNKYFNTSLSESRCGEVIIEEFIDGIESTVDSITYKGKTHVLGISDKEKIHTPNIIAMDLTFPPRYTKEMQGAVRETVCRSLEALSVDFGPSHVEVIVNDRGPHVIEVAGRAGGGLIPSDVLPHLCGFDVIEKYIKLALGEDPQIPEYALQNGVTLRFFKTPERGTLKSITGAEEAGRIDGVMKISFTIKRGDVLKPLKEDNDRGGFVIAMGKDRTQASAVADRAEEMIKFNVK